MKVPTLDLAAQYERIQGELRAAVERVLASQHFILGPEVEAFESEIQAACGVRHAIGVSSGSDALLVALMALGVRPGDEVVTTSYTFFATAGAVVRLGAKPVFVDIEPDTLNMDEGAAMAAATPRTKGFIPVHLFGQMASTAALVQAAAKRGAFVLEDAAQAIGATDAGRRVGTLGTAGIFSFFPSKNLGSIGDAGMVVTEDPVLAKRLKVLRVHGAEQKYHHDFVGGNFRLDAIHAAVLRVKLKHLEAWTQGRRAVADRYDALLADVTDVKVPVRRANRTHVFNQYVVRAPKRDQLAAELQKKGISTAVYYPKGLHVQPCFADLGYKEGQLPVTEAACRETLALPMYPELTAAQQQYVVDAIRAFYRG